MCQITPVPAKFLKYVLSKATPEIKELAAYLASWLRLLLRSVVACSTESRAG